jgi:stringent starvation protein B
MTDPTMADISTKPYLIRAIHEWCEDSGYRPYIAVVVDERTQVPQEFVRNGEIVLNVSAQATHRLRIGNDFVEFEARFSGAVRSVSIPVDNISAIYAQETGHGMAFDVVRAPSPKSPQPSQPRPVPSVAARTPVGQSAPASAEPLRPSPDRAARPRLVPKPVEATAEPGAPSVSAAPVAVKARPKAKPAEAAPQKDAAALDGAHAIAAPIAGTPAPPDASAGSADLPAASTGSAEPQAAPARKPRSPRRRTQASGVTGSETKTKSSVPAVRADASAAPASGAPEPVAPSAQTPSEPPKPSRGHLKRVK